MSDWLTSQSDSIICHCEERCDKEIQVNEVIAVRQGGERRGNLPALSLQQSKRQEDCFVFLVIDALSEFRSCV
jgi:hypothetical protein